jgi:hypothetical protein
VTTKEKQTMGASPEGKESLAERSGVSGNVQAQLYLDGAIREPQVTAFSLAIDNPDVRNCIP